MSKSLLSVFTPISSRLLRICSSKGSLAAGFLVILLSSGLSAQAATIDWGNVSTTWSTSSNWVGGVAPADASTIDTAQFGSNGTVKNPTLAGANRGIKGIIISSGAHGYTFTSTGAGAPYTLSIGTGGITDSAANTETFNLKVTLASGNHIWTNNTSGASLVFNNTVDLKADTTGSRSLTLTGAGNFSFNGTIQNSFSGSTGSLSLSSGFSGTATLGGANSYNGTTSVGGGTLLVNSTHTGGAYNINTGTLGGNGTITSSGAVTVNGAGLLSAGSAANTVGTLTLSGTGGLNVTTAVANETGEFIFNLDTVAASDKINLTNGTLNIGAGLNFADFAFTTTANVGSGDVFHLFTSTTPITGSLDANPANLTGSLGGSLTGTIGISGNDIILSVVPEPSSWTMLMAGVGLFLLVQRVRRGKGI